MLLSGCAGAPPAAPEASRGLPLYPNETPELRQLIDRTAYVNVTLVPDTGGYQATIVLDSLQASAGIGHQINEGPVRLMAHGGDERDLALGRGAHHSLVVEPP